MAVLEQSVKQNKRAYIFRLTLDVCGYFDTPATEEAVRACFADYVDCGVFSNVDNEDDLSEFGITEICRSLIGAGTSGRASR